MHSHSHDENNAPNQTDNAKPTDMTAHLARGVPGAEPPLEKNGAIDGDRDKTAAGFRAIYETWRDSDSRRWASNAAFKRC